MKYASYAAKAVVAAVVAGLSSLGAVLVDGHTIGSVTAAQWVVVATAVVTAGYGVFQTANGPAPVKQPEGQ